jgi:signal transduction histidine kinase
MKLPRDISAQWTLGWRMLAAATFLVVGTSVKLSTGPAWPGAGRFWALYAGLIVWYAVVAWVGRARMIRAEPWSLGLFAVGWVLWALLIPRHPASFGLAAVFFPATYSMLSIRYSVPAGLVLSAIMFLAGNRWSLRAAPGEILGMLLVVASSVMLSLFIHAIFRQSEERKRLIHELEATRASLAQAERQAGVLEERQRLAQEIHDTVAQGFVGIVTHLEAAETAPGLDGAAAAHVAHAKASARASLAEARRLVWELRPDLVEGKPVAELLERQLAEWSARSGVAALRIVTGTPRPLGADREAVLLQAAREALNNVRAHARANHVTLTLSYMDDEVALDVQDDGAGVNGARGAGGGGFGLRALEERVKALGGSCALESRAGEGATLTVTLPAGAEQV